MTQGVALPIILIDGSEITCYEDFVSQFDSQLDGFTWSGNSLDAFDDILAGDCGTPDGGFVFRWIHSARSREVLGHREVVEWLRNTSSEELANAKAGVGPTMFDWLVAIIQKHGPGGSLPESNVHLELC